MFELSETVLYATAGTASAMIVSLLWWNYRQGRKLREQDEQILSAEQNYTSLNNSNLGLGRRIKQLERGTPQVSSVSDSVTPLGDIAALVASSSESMASQPFNNEPLFPDSKTNNLELVNSPAPQVDPLAARAKERSFEETLQSLEATEQHIQQTVSELSSSELAAPTVFAQRNPTISDRELDDLDGQENYREQAFGPHYFQESSDQEQQGISAGEAMASENLEADSLDSGSLDSEPEEDLAQTPYTKASELLDRGMDLESVERLSGLSKAEVSLMATMHENMSKFAIA